MFPRAFLLWWKGVPAAQPRDVIVGRSRHLAFLDRALHGAEAGRPMSVLLVGAPGMGKTLLLEHAGREAMTRGWLVASATGCENSRRSTQSLAHDLVHALARGLHLDEVPDPSATALRDLVYDATQTQPVLLLVDDLQWADKESLAILTSATGRLAGARALVLAAGRAPVADDRGLSSWSRLDVGPLADDDAVVLLRRSIRRPLAPDQALRVARSLESCPLALVEVQRLLTPEQIEGSQPLPDPVPVHDRLRQAWRSTAESLDEPTRRALLALAVLGPGDAMLVHEVLTTLGARATDLAAALEAGLVRRTDGAPSIVSATVRAGVLDGHDVDEVRAMHRLVADTAVRTHQPPAVVVEHLSAVTTTSDDQVADLLEHQARRAEARDQPDAAAGAWLAAAQVSADPQTRVRRAVQAARVWLTQSTSATGAQDLLRLLRDLPLGPDDLVWLEWVRSEVLAETDLSRAATSALAAAHHAAVSTPTLTAWLLWDTAATAWMAGEPNLALRATHELQQRMRDGHDAGIGVPPWLPAAVHGTALLIAGRYREGTRLVARARQQAEHWTETASTPVTELLTVVALDELMMTDSATTRARAQALAARLGSDQGSAAAAVGVVQAWRSYRLGRWTAAVRLAENAVDMARGTGASAEERSALSLLAEIAAVRDPPDIASARVITLRQRARAAGDRRAVVSADYAEGVRHLCADDLPQAVLALERVADSALWGRSCSDAPLAGRITLVEAYLRSCDRTAATQLVGDLMPRLVDLQMIDPDAAAVASRLLALVADDDHGDELFERALSQHAAGRDPASRARTQLAFGRRLLDRSRPDQAQRELARALTGFETLGAAGWSRVTRRLVDRCRPIDDVGRAERDPLGDLTAQERRVALAVATGATNHEVADQLYLSVRTVEFHLSHIFAKLGLHHRSELARIVGSTATTP